MSKNHTELKFMQRAEELEYSSVKQMLETLYKKNSGVLAVGKILNVSGPTIHAYLKKYNIKTRPKGGNDPMINWESIANKKGYPSAKQYLSELLIDYSFSQIAAMFCCSVSTIYRAFKKYKIDAFSNKRKRRAKKEIINSMNKIGSKEKITLCSCCGIRPVAKGFKFLCLKCYGNN